QTRIPTFSDQSRHVEGVAQVGVAGAAYSRRQFHCTGLTASWSETDPATDGARIGVLAYRRQLRQERSSGDQADALACHQSPRRFAQRGHAADERGDVLFDLRQLQAQRMFSLLEMYS